VADYCERCNESFEFRKGEGGIPGVAYRLGFPRRALFRGVSYTFMIISTKLVVVRKILKCNNLLSVRQRPGYTEYTTRRPRCEYHKNMLSTRTSGLDLMRSRKVKSEVELITTSDGAQGVDATFSILTSIKL
jgi:hypothetical protein